MGGQLRDRKREARLPLGSRAPLASCAEGRRVRNAAALTYTTTSSYEQMLEEKGGVEPMEIYVSSLLSSALGTLQTPRRGREGRTDVKAWPIPSLP